MSAKKRRQGERGGQRHWVLRVAEWEGERFLPLGCWGFLKQFFKIVTASCIRIAAFPLSCRGNHVSTGRGRNWKGGNKEMKKEEGAIEGETPPPPSLVCWAPFFVPFSF